MENLPKALVGVHLLRWITTYPVDKVIRSLNNWGQAILVLQHFCPKLKMPIPFSLIACICLNFLMFLRESFSLSLGRQLSQNFVLTDPVPRVQKPHPIIEFLLK